MFKRPVSVISPQSLQERWSVSGLNPDRKQVSIAALAGAFIDKPYTQPTSRLHNILYGPWGTGSVADYYDEVSYGQVQLAGNVHGWYVASRPFAYYEARASGLGEYPKSAGGFVREIVSLADGTVPVEGLVDIEPDTQIVMTASDGANADARTVMTLPLR